jgi:hypothetical protein
MSFSGRYPEHDICENFNAIDVRELQRKNLLRPGLCFTIEWFRNGAGKILIMTQPDAIMLVYRARPPGATESRIVELRVPYHMDKTPPRRPPALVQMPEHCQR